MFDLDSVQLVWTARTMRDEGRLLSGRTLDPPPRWLIGAVENPFAPPAGFRQTLSSAGWPSTRTRNCRSGCQPTGRTAARSRSGSATRTTARPSAFRARSHSATAAW